MQPIIGNMTQSDFDAINDELTDLELRQMFMYTKDHDIRIKELRDKLGITDEKDES